MARCAHPSSVGCRRNGSLKHAYCLYGNRWLGNTWHAPTACRKGARVVVSCSVDSPTPDHDAEKTRSTGHVTQHQLVVDWVPLASRCAIAIATVCAALLLPAAGALAANIVAPSPASWLSSLVGFILHLDVHLSALIAAHGNAVYAILFAIVFCETGLVLTPFLPGDSLLFAAGAFASKGSLSLPLLCAVFISSAIFGDAVNYAVGAWIGSKLLKSSFISPSHIKKTQDFYAKHGGKTVVLARFIPIVRTFAPFVAGIGSMAYSKFAWYNVAGALIWTTLFVGAGFFFGNLPFVQHNFTLVVLGIVAVSVVPVLYELLAEARSSSSSSDSKPSDGTAAA